MYLIFYIMRMANYNNKLKIFHYKVNSFIVNKLEIFYQKNINLMLILKKKIEKLFLHTFQQFI